ncbi:MAG: DUF2442 domain-containing protein [Desulfovibrio sp.]|jgi:hypothetical protein|nr:DUF2442 domain-containing protein [Desulfovibrio sp.]
MSTEYNFIKIDDVIARSDHTLLLTFENGEKRIYDFKPKLARKVFASLKNPAKFMQARNDFYGVVWDDETDIASEECYYNGTPVTD